jgi:hypothetical protein
LSNFIIYVPFIRSHSKSQSKSRLSNKFIGPNSASLYYKLSIRNSKIWNMKCFEISEHQDCAKVLDFAALLIWSIIDFRLGVLNCQVYAIILKFETLLVPTISDKEFFFFFFFGGEGGKCCGSNPAVCAYLPTSIPLG